MARSLTKVLTLAVGMLMLFLVLAMTQRPVNHYPYTVVQFPDDLRLSFLLQNKKSQKECQEATVNLVSVIRGACPTCNVVENTCLRDLDSQQHRLLGEEPLPHPSARLPNGVAVYESSNPRIAQAACAESEKHSAAQTGAITCHPAHTVRSAKPQSKAGVERKMILGLGFALMAGVVTWLFCWLIIRYEHLHAHLSHDSTEGGPQKYHLVPTPRIGGIAIVAGLLATGGGMLILGMGESYALYGLLLVSAVPAFMGGLVEDITKRVGVMERLLLTMVSGAMAAWLLGGVLNRLDMPGLDQAMQYLPIALVFTVFAVGGVANAINIVDGYNGLASGLGVISLLAVAGVAAVLGDHLILSASLAMAGALLGFLAWNWPAGKIFMGDGGAYLLGFWLAELAILLVVRNPSVSPWFPILLLIHPIFETLFSIYRRQVLRGHAAGRPDALHLHQLIYHRIVRFHITNATPEHIIQRNSTVAPYMWAGSAFSALVAVLWNSYTPVLVGASLMSCAIYVYFYRSIMKWRVPGWMVRSQCWPMLCHFLTLNDRSASPAAHKP